MYKSPKVNRILMTTDSVGGIWDYCIDLARGLQRYGVEIVLVSMGKKLDIDQRKHMARLVNVELIETNFKLEWMAEPWSDVAESGKLLLDLEANYKPDLIHLNNFSHAKLGFSCPVIAAGHSCVYSWHQAVHGREPEKHRQRYFNSVCQGIHSADMIIAPSIFMLLQLRSIYGDFQNYRVIHNGSNVVPFNKRKEEFVLSAGRNWDESKNIKCLQKASKSIRWPVVIAGENKNPDDGGSAEFQNIQLTGLLSKNDLIETMSRASIFALPAKYEPFGLSILEAASCRCALVLGNIESLREIWQDNAIYVDPDDEKQLVTKVNQLIDNPELLKFYAKMAQFRARRYRVSRMTCKYMALYNCMLVQKGIFSR